MRDKCMNTNDGEWSHCNVCNGRIHEDDCKGRKLKGRDCFGQELHTPEEMEAAGYGPADEHRRYREIP